MDKDISSFSWYKNVQERNGICDIKECNEKALYLSGKFNGQFRSLLLCEHHKNFARHYTVVSLYDPDEKRVYNLDLSTPLWQIDEKQIKCTMEEYKSEEEIFDIQNIQNIIDNMSSKWKIRIAEK